MDILDKVGSVAMKLSILQPKLRSIPTQRRLLPTIAAAAAQPPPICLKSGTRHQVCAFTCLYLSISMSLCLSVCLSVSVRPSVS